MRIRVLVWNVHGFRAGVAAIARVVDGLAPDLVLLNETGWTGFRLWRFARRIGAKRASGHRFWRRGLPNAVLVRAPWRLIAEGLRVLPHRRRDRRRGVVPAVVGRSGYRLTAAAVHLGLAPTERLIHAKEVADLVRAFKQPVLLGGDLNEGPDEPAASWLAERLWDGFAAAGRGPGETFPADDPQARIDYLFTTEGARVTSAEVVREAAEASDHLPLLAEVELS